MARPTKYKKKYCDELIRHMAQGYSYETFGAVIGTCKQTIYTWEGLHPEFLDAKREAFAVCQMFWEKLGIDHITNTHQGTRLNGQVWALNMKNRFSWRDKVEQEVLATEKKDVTITFTSEAPRRGPDYFDNEEDS